MVSNLIVVSLMCCAVFGAKSAQAQEYGNSLPVKPHVDSKDRERRDPDAQMADLFYSKNDQIGRFRISISSNQLERLTRTHFVFAELLARLLSRASLHPDAKCISMLGVQFDIEGFWVRGRAGRNTRVNTSDCALELAELIQNYRPTSAEIEWAKNQLVKRYRGPLPAVSSHDEVKIVEALKTVLPTITRKYESLPKQHHDQSAKRSSERSRVIQLTRLFLSRALRHDWPGRPYLSVEAADFEKVDARAFALWLDRQRKRAAIEIGMSSGRPFPWKGQSAISDEFSRAGVHHIPRPSGTGEHFHFMISYIPPDSDRLRSLRNECRSGGGGPLAAFCRAQSFVFTSPPDLSLLITYFVANGGQESRNAIATLQEIAALPDFTKFRSSGAEYGFGRSFLVSTREPIE